MTRTWLTASVMLALLGCSKDDEAGAAAAASASAAAASASAAAAAASASAATAAAAATASAAAATASAAAAPEPHHDCPAGSTGPGSFDKPCEAKKSARMMQVKWTKTGDNGPSFSVTNKSQLVILWGKVAVYFYDKAGKQLNVQDNSESPPKTRPFHTCSGSFFGGVMNPADKYVITFSCVPKSVIPDGTATVEAEMQMVGFTDAGGKKLDFYWRNADLTPDVRPKGGVK
jgi:hypothetical protein